MESFLSSFGWAGINSTNNEFSIEGMKNGRWKQSDS